MEDKQKKSDKMLISLLASWARLMKKPFLVWGVNVFPTHFQLSWPYSSALLFYQQKK